MSPSKMHVLIDVELHDLGFCSHGDHQGVVFAPRNASGIFETEAGYDEVIADGNSPFVTVLNMPVERSIDRAQEAQILCMN